MKSIFATILAVTATIVSAQSNIVSITSPLTGNVYTAGQPAIISWIDQTVDVITKITLAKGNPNALQPVATIAENVDATTGTHVWNIPSDTAAGEDYAFELGTSPNMSFTGLFTIDNGNANSNAVNTAAPVSSAAASASSSSAVSSASTSASASATPTADTAAQEQVAQSAAGMRNKASYAAMAVAGVAAAAALI